MTLQATYALGTTVHLEQAVRDAQRAHTVEPANDTIAAALRAWQRELREQNRRDRGTFGNMFRRGDLYPQQASAPDATGQGSDSIKACARPAPARLAASGTSLSLEYATPRVRVVRSLSL